MVIPNNQNIWRYVQKNTLQRGGAGYFGRHVGKDVWVSFLTNEESLGHCIALKVIGYQGLTQPQRVIASYLSTLNAKEPDITSISQHHIRLFARLGKEAVHDISAVALSSSYEE